MNIIINGEPKLVNENTTLENFVFDTIMDTKGMAIALNDSVIPKKQWAETLLKENDQVLIIRATQGG